MAILKTAICLDTDEYFWTAMTYSDVLDALADIDQSTVFVEFTDIHGHKHAVSIAHVVEVYGADRTSKGN